jgi:hypothetical protein
MIKMTTPDTGQMEQITVTTMTVADWGATPVKKRFTGTWVWTNGSVQLAYTKGGRFALYREDTDLRVCDDLDALKDALDDTNISDESRLWVYEKAVQAIGGVVALDI